jgi:hypothetical protein
VPLLKKGILFNLTSEDMTKIVSYITEIKYTDFGSRTANTMQFVLYCKENWGRKESFNSVPNFVSVVMNPTKVCESSQTMILKALLFVTKTFI